MLRVERAPHGARRCAMETETHATFDDLSWVPREPRHRHDVVRIRRWTTPRVARGAVLEREWHVEVRVDGVEPVVRHGMSERDSRAIVERVQDRAGVWELDSE